MCHRKFNANTLLLMRFLCINVFILLPSRKVYYLFLFTVFVYISIGDYLAYSGELNIPLVPAPEWQFDFELILALMAAINLFIGIYIGPIHIYIGHLIVFWVMYVRFVVFFFLWISFFNNFCTSAYHLFLLPFTFCCCFLFVSVCFFASFQIFHSISWCFCATPTRKVIFKKNV